jgi:uncharacterized protein YacL
MSANTSGDSIIESTSNIVIATALFLRNLMYFLSPFVYFYRETDSVSKTLKELASTRDTSSSTIKHQTSGIVLGLILKNLLIPLSITKQMF